MKAIRFLRTIVMVMAVILSGMGESLAAEKKFPTKPIEVICPFPPGGTDVMTRPFVEKLPAYLGQPVTYVYKPGAAGFLGTDYVAHAKPDGYTLLVASISPIVIVPLSHPGGYTWKSFEPIGCFPAAPFTLSVRSDSRWKNLQEFVEEARKNPGKITYTGAGTLGIAQFAAEAFFKEAGINLTYIPSLGTGPAVSAILGGHVDITCVSAEGPYPHVKAGTMRVLAVLAEKRFKILPDVPTASEFGYPAVIVNVNGLLAPKGTPKEIVETIYQALKKIWEDQHASIQERFDKLCAEADLKNSEEYVAIIKDSDVFYSNMFKQLTKK